jgi:hypothetical protein
VGPQNNPFLAPLDLVVDASLLDNDPTTEDVAPSREDLLARAVALGPPRPTLDNITFAATDPILGAKMQPRVAERRARFRKVVKVALGVCVACCLVATGATALSTNEAHARTSGVGVKTAPASGATPVEKLEIVLHTKAPGSRVAARTPKWGKRR